MVGGGGFQVGLKSMAVEIPGKVWGEVITGSLEVFPGVISTIVKVDGTLEFRV